MSPIYGLTDRGLAFAQIGVIRKGAPKDPGGNKPGRDLEYFRAVFDEAETDSSAKFVDAYGKEPKLINILFPFNDIDAIAQFWLEAYTAGRMVARSDGRIYTYKVDTKTGEIIVRNGVNVKTGQPEPYKPEEPAGYYTNQKGKEEPIWCKGVGRIRLVVPELKRFAYMLLMTTSQHDIMNLSEQLAGIWESNNHRIAGVPFILQRKPRKVSCPDPNDKTKRARRTKWLLSIEPNPLWVESKLLAMGKEAFMLNPGERRLALQPGEAAKVVDEDIPKDTDWVDVAPVDDFNDDEDGEPTDAEFTEEETTEPETTAPVSAPPPVAAKEKPWTSKKVSQGLAKTELSSDNTKYWDMTTDDLVIRLNGIQKTLDKNGLDEKDKAEKLIKRDVMQAILEYRAEPEKF